MTAVKYWSDLHLGHEFVARERGFETAEQHDNHIIETWHRTVNKRDQVWLLGDLTLGSTTKALAQLADLPGTKHLIFGNHDQGHPMHRKAPGAQAKYLQVFKSASAFARHKIAGVDVMVSHFPYAGGSTFIEPGPEWRETDAPGYFANVEGQIRGRFGRVLKPWVAGHGYLYVATSNGAEGVKNRTVHSLVCSAFHGTKPEGMQVAHNDGNPLNNRASNLRWATPKENAADRVEHGTAAGQRYSRSGDENPKAKLGWDDVSFIREATDSVAELAEVFEVSTSTIRDIRSGRTWAPREEPIVGDHPGKGDRYMQYRLPNEGMPLIHGHVHAEWVLRDRQLNVGVDVWPEGPVEATYIMQMMGMA